MRIGVDARLLYYQRAGISTYIRGLLGGLAAVAGDEQLVILRAEERPHFRREPRVDATRPEGHDTATFRARAAASSTSSDWSLMKPSAASCGNVSPVA